MTVPTEFIPHNDRDAIVNAIIGVIIIAYLWNTTVLKGFLYPLVLFITFVHETGQRLVVALAGGTSTNFVLDLTGLGRSTIEGTNVLVSAPAGFLTSALVGTFLFVWINRYPNHSGRIAIGLGVGTISASIYYVLPLLPQEWPALLMSMLLGTGLILSGLRLNVIPRLILLNILVISLALEAFISIRQVSNVTSVNDRLLPDAQVFAEALNLPPLVVAAGWGMLVLGFFTLVFWLRVWPSLRSNTTVRNR